MKWRLTLIMVSLEKFNPKDYKRLFEFESYPLFIDSLWLESDWEMQKVLITNVNNLRTSYIPYSAFSNTLKEGKELYGNKIRLNAFLKDFDDIELKSLNISRDLVK